MREGQFKTEKDQTEETKFIVQSSILCRFGFHSSTPLKFDFPVITAQNTFAMPYIGLVLVVMIASAHALAEHPPLHRSATVPIYDDNADTSLSSPSRTFERFAFMSAMDLQTDTLGTASEICGYYSGASLRHPINAHQVIHAILISMVSQECL